MGSPPQYAPTALPKLKATCTKAAPIISPPLEKRNSSSCCGADTRTGKPCRRTASVRQCPDRTRGKSGEQSENHDCLYAQYGFARRIAVGQLTAQQVSHAHAASGQYHKHGDLGRGESRNPVHERADIAVPAEDTSIPESGRSHDEPGCRTFQEAELSFQSCVRKRFHSRNQTVEQDEGEDAPCPLNRKITRQETMSLNHVPAGMPMRLATVMPEHMMAMAEVLLPRGASRSATMEPTPKYAPCGKPEMNRKSTPRWRSEQEAIRRLPVR